jgi:hypothetical protein
MVPCVLLASQPPVKSDVATFGRTQAVVLTVIADPPSDAGDDHDNDTCPPPATAAKPNGADGAEAVGVADTTDENVPEPAEFTARTRNTYSTPPDNPVTEAVVAADTPSFTNANDDPPFDDRNTR